MISRKSLLLSFISTIFLFSCQPTNQTAINTISPSPTEKFVVQASTTPTTETATPNPTPTLTPTKPSFSVTENDLSNYPQNGYGPSNFPENINPLTGLPVSDSTILNRYPIAVKISIIPRRMSRPPWGISKADMVFDYYHNNGYTRFHAIFYGNDAELVGPIRSARLLDNTLIQAYKSIFAYGSADARINRVLFNASYSNRLALEGSSHNCPPSSENPFCRYDPNGTNTLLIDTNALTQYMAEKRNLLPQRQYLDGYYFNAIPPADALPGKIIYTRYSGDSYNKWEYDETLHRYLRFQDNVYDQGQGEKYAPMVDRLTNEQVVADNVIILFAEHDYYYKTATSEIVKINLNGYGKAIVFRDGNAYKVNWARVNKNDVVALTYDDGSRFPLRPGITWFQVIGVSSTVNQDEAEWRFEFLIP